MTPEKLQQEAELLYPREIVLGKPNTDRFTFNEIADLQRATHVACAEKYTAIIEGLKQKHEERILILALDMQKKDQEIERLRAENERLKTPEAMREAMVEYYTWRVTSGWELHSSGDYYYRSKDRHQWPPEETCELHELFQHFLKDANKASALKTPTL